MDIKLAERLSKSRFVPKEFRGQPEDLYFVLDFVERLKGEVSLLQALRGIYFSNGEPSMKAHLLLSIINNEKISPFKGGITWKVKKTEDDLEVTASVTTKGEVQSETLKLSDAKKAYFRNTIWETHPEYMLKIRTATLLTRTWASYLLTGLSTEDELLDINGNNNNKNSINNYEQVHSLLNK